MQISKILSLSLCGALATGLAMAALSSSDAEAGFFSSTMGARVDDGGDTHISLPATIGGTGILQDAYPLDPENWNRYRIRIYHDDATFPSLGWASDSFLPTAENEEIRIGAYPGSQAGEIYIGSESLDWSDSSKITVVVQAKACPTCSWQSYTTY